MSTIATVLPLLDGPKTAKEMDTTTIVMNALAEEGVVEIKSKRKNVVSIDADGNEVYGKGRPSHVWKLTKNGRAKAKRAAAKMA